MTRACCISHSISSKAPTDYLNYKEAEEFAYFAYTPTEVMRIACLFRWCRPVTYMLRCRSRSREKLLRC